MTDVATLPPMGLLERWTSTLGNLARPWVLWSSSTSASFATGYIPFSGVSLAEGAIYIGAAWAGVAALYTAKSLEEGRKAKVEGQVAIAQTGSQSS